MSYDLSRLGWDDSFASAFAPLRRPDTRPGRVLHADLGVCTVLDADGVTRASLAGAVLLGAARDPALLPCAGDWVVLRRWPDRRTTLDCVLPRRTAVIGRDGAGRVLAANADLVAVVEPAHPRPDAARVERLLALARESGARPVLVLSKCDTAPGRGGPVAPMPEVPVVPVSAVRGDGLDRLRALIAPDHTLALLGAPGAGKSTLADALGGTGVMPVRQVRRHPGTYRRLVPVPGGGAVLDTPGIGEAGLLPAEAAGPRRRRPG